MRKSFTRLFSLVMFLTLLSTVSMAAVPSAPTVWPSGTTAPTALTKITDKILVIYPEAVKASTGSVRVSKTDDDALVAVIPANDVRISYAKGDTVTIDLSASLAESTDYTIALDPATFKLASTAGTDQSAYSWSFTTGDYTAPVLTKTELFPVLSTAVNTATVKLTFKDASTPATLGTGRVAIYKADGNLWDFVDIASATFASVGLGADGLYSYTLTLPVSRVLEDLTTYVVTVDAGAIKDAGLRNDSKKNVSVALTDRTVFTFTTPNYSAPGFTTGYPKAGTLNGTTAGVLISTAVAGKAYAIINTSATLLNPTTLIKGATFVKTITVAAGTEYAIDFTTLSSDNTTVLSNAAGPYFIHIATENADGVVSTTDVVYAGTASPATGIVLDQTNAPVVATSATAISYNKGTTVKATANGSFAIQTGSAVNTAFLPATLAVPQDVDNIVITFDKVVKIGAGNLMIYSAADNAVFATVASTSLSLDATKTKLKVPVTGLANNASYYITIPNTLVADSYANKYAGISSISTWTFTTNDIVKPTFTYLPVEGANNVAIDKPVVLTFSEIVKYNPLAVPAATALNSFIVKAGTSTLVAGTHYNAVLTDNGVISTCTITPVAGNFPSQAVISVQIVANSLTDAGSNVVDTQGQGINFVIVDKTAPDFASWGTTTKPADPIVIKFTEPVVLKGGGEITNANLWTILDVKENNINGVPVANTPTISADKKTITIVPTTPWASQKTYFVSVSADIQDAAGNVLAAAATRTHTYVIDDVTSATVNLSSVDGKSIVPTAFTFNLVFSDPAPTGVTAAPERTSLYYNNTWNTVAPAAAGGFMNKVIILKENDANGADVAFTVASADGITFTITPTLEGNKTYYVGVGASTKGVDGNVSVAKFVNFTTKSVAAPKAVTLSPADGDVQIAEGSKLVITFDTEVTLDAATGIVVTDGTTPYTVQTADVSVVGKVATITLPTANKLVANKSYVVTVSAGAFLNVNAPNLPNAAFAAGAWDFVTVDTKIDFAAAPNALAPDEDDAAAAVGTTALDAKLVMKFNEKVVKGAGTIVIKKYDTDALVESIDVVSANVVLSADQKTVTITPSANFVYNQAYYVEVAAGAIKDVVGNSIAAIAGKLFDTVSPFTATWTFKTANPALSIFKVTPASGSDKVLNTASIVVEFNREIAPVTTPITGSVGYFEGLAAATPQAYVIGSSNVVISGKTMTISHGDKVFPASTTVATAIYLNIPAGVIKAATDATILNAAVNQTTNPKYFNTGDVNGPVATFNPAAFVSLTPVYTATDASISITFDEDAFNTLGSALTATNVSSGGGIFSFAPVVPSFAGTVSGRTVTLTPSVPFAEFTQYTLSIAAGTIQDANAHLNLAAASTFKTVDKTAPVINTFTLTGADTKITVPAVTITDADAASKFYYLVREKSTATAPTALEIKAANSKDASTGTVGTFDIKSLTPSTTYQVYYVADDKTGNTSTVAVLEATTIDNVAPLLVSSTPANGAVDVKATAGTVVVKLTFNETVAIGTGTITVRDYATKAIIGTYTEAALGATTPVDAKSLNLTLTGLLSATAAPVKLYVEIASGVIKDAATTPNNFAGILGSALLAFTTEDNAVPAVDAVESSGGVTPFTLASNADIKIAFTEDVKAGSGSVVLYKIDTTTPANAIQVFTAAEATFSGKTATINPTADLVGGTVYVVSVGAGFAKDLSTNANANAVSNAVTFTASATLVPAVTSVTPAGGTTAVAVRPSSTPGTLEAGISILFNTPIYLTVAGYHKPLALMTQAELLAHVSIKDINGAAVTIDQVIKTSGSEIKLLPTVDKLLDLSTYTLTITGFENVDGVVIADKTVTYITSDGTSPTITFLPANNATKVSLASSLTLTISEDFYSSIVDATKNLFVYVTADNVKNFVYLREASNTATTDVAFTATIAGKVITIVPGAALKSGTDYYYGFKLPIVDLNNQPIVVTAGTPAFGTVGTTAAKFSTADVTAPALAAFTSSNYAPQGSGVAPTATMFVTFNEDVVVSTGSIVIRREDGTIFQTVSGNDLTVDGAKLKIAHNAFEANMNYFVEVGASAVVDKSGNANVKFSSPLAATGWLFTTNDSYALTATVSPNATTTPRTVNLALTFNKVPTGQTNKFINVYKADGTAVYHIAAPLVANGKVVSMPVVLEAGTSYYARVDAGAFKDASSNEFAGIMDNSWVFTAVSDFSPVAKTLLPADNATAVDPATNTFAVTFDRNIALGTGVISVRYSLDGAILEDVDVSTATIDGKTLTFKITKALVPNTSFYVIVPAGAVINTEITKDASVGIVNTYDWNFTTSTDLTAPKLLTWTPNATTLTTTEKNHPTLVMTFDEALVLGAGNVKVYKKSDNTLALTIPVSAAMVNGKTVTVTYSVVAPATGLDQNTDYYVLVDGGIVKDAAGNATAAVTDVAAWTFKTNDGFITVIPEISDSQFKVYPNPFVDYVTVTNASELSKVVVSNIAGQVVKEVVAPESTIQLNELRSGVYFISLYQDGAVIKTAKIVKR